MPRSSGKPRDRGPHGANRFADESSLVAGCRDGCPHALATLYARYARATGVYLRSLARRLAAPELAQDSGLADLVQEVFVRAFAPAIRGRYSSLAGFDAYLKVIARHHVIDILRTRRREVLVGDARQLHEAASAPVEPFLDHADERLVTFVRACVARLPLPLRDLYEQRFVLGCSQEQAGQVLAVSRRQVRTLEQHLYRDLRRMLRRSARTPSPWPREHRVHSASRQQRAPVL
jgi:RNA polymerase sigma factor (sigma-70 family)